MNPKTIWQSASDAEGKTESERYLTKLAKKAFLSLWSYSNLFSDEGRASGKGDGNELCDLLVVFGNNVLLFSDKECKFTQHQDIMVSWSRWYKRAIEKSVRQLIGAEKFLREHPGRIFLDKSCQTRLPLELPSSSVATYYLIAVTRGSHEPSKMYFGGGSSGSLLIDTLIDGDVHYKNPFRVGWPAANKRFIHVLDEMTLNILLEELDTVPDIIEYLQQKEVFLTQPGVNVVVAGEEQSMKPMLTAIFGIG